MVLPRINFSRKKGVTKRTRTISLPRVVVIKKTSLGSGNSRAIPLENLLLILAIYLVDAFVLSCLGLLSLLSARVSIKAKGKVKTEIYLLFIVF